jgi:hypothetical protein
MGRIKPFHISGKPFGTKLLTPEQIGEIIEKYPYVLNKDLCEEYNVSKHIIVELAFHYSINKDNSFRGWKTNKEPVDLVMFDWFYPKTSNPQLQEVFGKSDHFIRALAKERNLVKYEDVLSAKYSKSKPRILYSISGVHYESEDIDLNDVLYIVEYYPTETNNYLAEIIGCKNSTIVSIARYYELSKDQESVKKRKKKILVERNKRLGRDVTAELIKSEALKYFSKREFCDRDPSLYATANRMGIMEEVTKHMVNMSFSVPQIISRQITEYLFNQKCEYNTRKIISPYELDVYFPNLKLAFEYDGKGWHQNDEIDKIQLCKEKGILLIKLFERSRRFREDIQKYLIENLKLINSWCNTDITEEQILLFDDPIDFPRLFTDEELLILRNNTVTYLRRYHLNLYNRYIKYNPDNINLKKSYKGEIVWDEEQVLAELSKYSSISELLKHSPNVYLAVTRKFRHLMPLYGKSRDKSVMCLDTNEIFKSTSEAGRILNIPAQAISRVCRGEREKTHNKKFKYIQ